MSADLLTWALPRLERLLPLDSDSLKQVIEYADSLSKEGAAEHLKNLLGDSPLSLEFISNFNTRRKNVRATDAPAGPASGNASRQASPPGDGVPRGKPRPQQKKKTNIHALPARQVIDRGQVSGAYKKQDESDYMAASSKRHRAKDEFASSLSLSDRPEIAPTGPTIVDTAAQARSSLHVTTDQQQHSTSSGPLSPSINPNNSSGASSPAVTANTGSTSSSSHNKKATTTVKIPGGKPMQGGSTVLSDLDAAIRSLELQTNPTLSSTSATSPEEDRRLRSCDCMATVHQLQTAAPNCLSCGKIICLKQGLGPCTFCGAALLSREDIASLLRVLKDERGKERMETGNRAHKRADVVASKPRAFTGRDFLSSSLASSSAGPSPLSASPLSSAGPASRAGSRDASPRPGTASAAGAQDSTSAQAGGLRVPGGAAEAMAHRDKLLGFQAQNARRTTVHDEAADFSVPVLGAAGDGSLRGGSIWASPSERAAELKKQQRALREMEFNARPEWERKREVASIDLVGGRIVRRFVERKFEDRQGGDSAHTEAEQENGGSERGAQAMTTPAVGASDRGALGRNPLLGKLIRPVYKAPNTASEEGAGKRDRAQGQTWRRVQDDLDDNEDVILDGGVKGFERGPGVEVA